LEAAKGSGMHKMAHQFSFAQLLVALSITLFLLAFLIAPVLNVIHIAFSDRSGGLTLSHFGAFFGISLIQE
jgi:iron(III) transport system permease protein